jgi:hypothetical protein
MCIAQFHFTAAWGAARMFTALRGMIPNPRVP